MLDAVIVGVLLFAPGTVLFYLPVFKKWVNFTYLEKMLVGTIAWLSFFVFLSYIGSLFSDVLFSFEFFMAVSTIVLALGVVTAWKSRKGILKLRPGRENLLMMLVLIILPLLVVSLIIAQTIYLEYDAIFYYFPLAKSIVLMGGLQTDFFQQSMIMSTTEPAIPLMYAFAGFVSGNPLQYEPASLMIPFAFILLTALAIYLASKEIFDSLVGIASAGVFLALPITSAMASHYAFYLDVAFTFFIATVLFATVKVYKAGQTNRAWWLVLGMAIALSVMERDLMFFLIPAIVAILLVPIMRDVGARGRWMSLLVLSIVFTTAYNFFFVVNLRASSLSATATLIREIPVVFAIFVFLTLCAFPQRTMRFPRTKTLLLALLPLLVPLIFILRNISSAGAITSNYPIFNRDWQTALSLMALAGRPSTSSSNIAQLFHWNTLLLNPLAGGAFIVPLLLGLSFIIFQAVRKSEEHDRTPYFILLCFFLALLLMWSWVFGSSFQGPELRRLDYFAPLLSMFIGSGTVAFAKYLGLGRVRHRIALFLLLTTAYFWFSSFGSAWNIVNIAYAFDAIGGVQITPFIVFSAFFILSFYPAPLFPNMSNLQQPIRRAMPYIATILAVCLIITSGYFLAYNSSVLLKNQSQTSSEVPKAWENDLSSIITYLNSNENNNGTIVASYALPIAYFTPHPVIDLTTLSGVIDLSRISRDPGNTATQFLNNGVRYLLLPTTTNNYYDYTQNLATAVGALGLGMQESPNIVLIKNFQDYNLYQIVPSTNLSSFYSYLYSGGNQWSPLDSSTKLLDLNYGVSMMGADSNNLTLDGGNQTAFWTDATASSADHMAISNDNSNAGAASLRISLNGVGNMVIEHIYETPQNWGNYSFISFYFYGENTSKSITLTFHTNGWVDYFAAAFKDNFTGWKEIQIPLDTFIKYGSPTWSSINFIEFLMGGRTTTYWLGDLSLQGYWLGVSGSIPPVSYQGASTKVVISINMNSTALPPYLVVNSSSGVFQQELSGGINYVSMPSSYLSQGANIQIVAPSLRDNAGMTLYYFGVLS